MERLIELFINTEDGEFYDRGGLLAAYDPAINAGELVRLTVQLCAGVPAFNSAGALLNPDTTFAGTLAAAETIIDNNFNWYDKGTLLENLTTGTAISELSVASEAAPRQLGAVRLNAGTVVNFCGWTATEGGYRLTLADNEFNPAQFTPPADFAQGAAVEVLEQPIIVSAQNDDSGRENGLFSGLLDAANPVYESMIEGQEDIPNCRIEFSIYQDGRAVFRARRYFDCLGAMAMNKGAAYVHSDSWREADSRYIKLVDWQAPPEYQFSEDGTNWHDQQQDADLYYHERRPGGQWGGAVKMKIGPTGAAAGFGTPSVTVETLPAGSDATASVATSGDNTAKVFNFNFGIPKGADGKNGTDGKAGADGADGVSSYTYVAYASDASGAGFSLTPTNALKYRAEIHTTTAIETPDAEDFAGATWVKYIGDDGTGAGDMLKSVYDTDDDGIVDHAATADAVGATTAAQVADAVGKAHTHANKTTLDKLAEADGKLTYDGAEIGGGSGTVKSVNGQTPDSSGAVTIPAATASAAGLMAAADKAAIAGLTTHGIYPNASARSGAVDFNEVIDHGFYFIGGDTPHLNYPETYQQNGGFSQVLRNGNYLVQTFAPVNTNKVFIRSGLKALSDLSERIFSAWRRLLTDTDITEFKARPGYFKLPGGMIVQWGAATIMNDGLYQVTFPIAFPNAIFIGNATAVSGTASASGVVISISEPQTNRMTLITKNHPGSDQDINVHWLAIGY